MSSIAEEDSVPKPTEVYEVICTPSGSCGWNDTNTRLLLSQMPLMMEKVRTREIPSKKIMYQHLTAFMRENGNHFQYGQIENRWKTLLRSYKNSMKKSILGLTGKHFCAYQKEIKLVLDKLSGWNEFDFNAETGDDTMDATGYIEFDACEEGEVTTAPPSKRHCDREVQAEYSAIAAQIVANEMGSIPRPGQTRTKQETRVAEQLTLLRRDLRELNEQKGRSTNAQVIDQLYLLREDIRRAQAESERSQAKRHREMMGVLNSIAASLSSINSNCNQSATINGQQ